MAYMRLGDLLVSSGVITNEQLEKRLKCRRRQRSAWAMCSSAPTLSRSSLIERAFSERASDIHLEPQDGEMVVRMRIDGLLRRVLTVPSELQSTVISRLKIMGGMNIAEHIAASLTLRGWSPRRSVWS